MKNVEAMNDQVGRMLECELIVLDRPSQVVVPKRLNMLKLTPASEEVQELTGNWVAATRLLNFSVVRSLQAR